MNSTDTAKPPKGLFLSRPMAARLNVYDSELQCAIVLRPLGYAPVDGPEQADLRCFNTCHIPRKGDRKKSIRARPASSG